MNKKILIASISAIFLSACSNNPTEPADPLTSTIVGSVSNSSDSSAISNANVSLYDANTNEPVNRVLTDSEGNYTFTVIEGNFYLKIDAQGYYSAPPEDGAPIPFGAPGNDTTLQQIFLDARPDSSTLGGFSGNVNPSDTSGISGVLIIATSSQNTFSGTTGPDGYYVFYNVPPGTYQLEYHVAEYLPVSTGVTVTVTAGVITDNVDSEMASGAMGKVSGQVSFVAVSNPSFDVDVTVIHPQAREAIPGLSTFINAQGGSYSISSIPYDTYIVWASYRNDGLVMDPDAIHKSGLPIITFSDAFHETSISFKVTGAVELISPTNLPDSVYPTPIFTTQPTFTWTKTSSYASVKEYIIEVFNSKGEVIWGGFDDNGVIRHPKIDPQETTSVVYNFDGSAINPLEQGQTYRWKVYADDDADPNVQTLLSSSENLMGLFKVTFDSTVNH